ncbi:MAG: hypothetical protein Q8O06_00035, partial [Acetobacterium sp.]|nr:hypothetical protein [Acetobacterium sp.]
NVYELIKNIGYLVDKDAKKIRFDIFYFLSTYFLLLTALVVSDVIFVMNMAGLVSTSIQGFSNLLWFTAFVMFVLGVFIALTTEKRGNECIEFFYHRPNVCQLLSDVDYRNGLWRFFVF